MRQRQQDLIIEFVQHGVHLQAFLDQWGDLHSLNGMKRREYNNQLHTRSLIPSFWKLTEKCRTQMEKQIAPLHLWHQEGQKPYKMCENLHKMTFAPPASSTFNYVQIPLPLHFSSCLSFYNTTTLKNWGFFHLEYKLFYRMDQQA